MAIIAKSKLKTLIKVFSISIFKSIERHSREATALEEPRPN